MKPAREIRILVADSQAMFCEALRHLLEEEPGFRVVGQAVTGREALEKAAELKPDVLLLGLPLERPGGLEVAGRLACEPLQVRSVILAEQVDRFHVIDALKAGARGVLPKGAPAELLFKCVRTVADGEYWIGRKGIADLVECFRAAVLAEQAEKRTNGFDLTRRETRNCLGRLGDFGRIWDRNGGSRANGGGDRLCQEHDGIHASKLARAED